VRQAQSSPAHIGGNVVRNAARSDSKTEDGGGGRKEKKGKERKGI